MLIKFYMIKEFINEIFPNINFFWIPNIIIKFFYINFHNLWLDFHITYSFYEDNEFSFSLRNFISTFEIKEKLVTTNMNIWIQSNNKYTILSFLLSRFNKKFLGFFWYIYKWASNIFQCNFLSRRTFKSKILNKFSNVNKEMHASNCLTYA